MTGKRYAILIGCKSYPDEKELHDLRCPLNDVRGLGEILNDINLGGCDTTVLENPTGHVAKTSIERVCNRAKRDDTIIIYYSGHGKPDRSGTLHLAATDTTLDLLQSSAISMDYIKANINNSDAINAVLLLDCCYSGAVGKTFSKGHVEDQLNATNRGSGMYIMSASTEFQTAQEKEEDKYGVFTKHLIEGVKSGAADKDGDGLITLHDIYDYVFAKVTSENHQEPKKWEIDARGTLLFSGSGIGRKLGEETTNTTKPTITETVLPKYSVETGYIDFPAGQSFRVWLRLDAPVITQDFVELALRDLLRADSLFAPVATKARFAINAVLISSDDFIFGTEYDNTVKVLYEVRDNESRKIIFNKVIQSSDDGELEIDLPGIDLDKETIVDARTEAVNSNLLEFYRFFCDHFRVRPVA